MSSKGVSANFVREQANLSHNEARRLRDSRVGQLRLSMPLQFASEPDYIDKLSELLLIEAEVEKLNTEMIAEKSIEFHFEERLEIYSRLMLFVSKDIQ